MSEPGIVVAKALRPNHPLQFAGRSRTNFVVFLVAVAAMAVLSLTVPNFMNVRNMLNIVEQISVIGFLSIGLTFVLVSGGIDLSSYAVVSAAAVVGADFMIHGGSPVLAVLIILGIALCFGVINAIAIAVFRMTPFIVTLSTMMLAQGFAVMFAKKTSITGLPQGFIDVAGGTLFGVLPVPSLMIILFALITGVLLKATRYGRWIYLLGTNEQAARVSGIPTVLAKASTYIISSLSAGLTAIFLMGIISAATTAMVGDVRLMDIISANIIGGASLSGGSGSVLGTVLGVLFIIVLSNCMNMLSVEPYLAMTLKGLIIVVIIGLDVVRSRSSGRRA